MLILRKVFSDWLEDENLAEGEGVKLLVLIKRLQNLCEEVGRDWNPPEPEKIDLLGFMAREALETHQEETLPFQQHNNPMQSSTVSRDYIILNRHYIK